MDIERDRYGNLVLKLERGRFLLDIQHDDAMVKAWLYPGDHDFSQPVNLDRFALDLGELGEDPDDDWYDLPEIEIAAMIAEALDMTETAAGIEVDRRAASAGQTAVIGGLADWAQAGLKLAETLQTICDAAGCKVVPATHAIDDGEAVDQMMDALLVYQTDLAADLSRAWRKIPYAISVEDAS